MEIGAAMMRDARPREAVEVAMLDKRLAGEQPPKDVARKMGAHIVRGS